MEKIMANYMRTYLRLSGSKNVVEAALNKMWEGDKLEFSKLAPMPPELNTQVTAGWKIRDIDYKSMNPEGFRKALKDLTETKYKWNEKVVRQEGNKFWYVRERTDLPDQPVFNDSEIEALVKSYEQTGYPSSEEFVTKEWGSGYTWSMFDEPRPQIEFDEELGFYTARMNLESKWSAPMYLVEKLSIMFPELEIYVSLSLELEYNNDIYVYKNGQVVSTFHGDNSFIFYGNGSEHKSDSVHELIIYDSSIKCLEKYEEEVSEYIINSEGSSKPDLVATLNAKECSLTINWNSVQDYEFYIINLIEKNREDNAMFSYTETAYLPVDVDGEKYSIIRKSVIQGSLGRFNGLGIIVENERAEAVMAHNNMDQTDFESVGDQLKNDGSEGQIEFGPLYKKPKGPEPIKFHKDYDPERWFVIKDDGSKEYNPDYDDAPF